MAKRILIYRTRRVSFEATEFAFSPARACALMRSVGICRPPTASVHPPLMTNPKIFLSCGQFTEDEKKLGKQIAEIVELETGHKVFYAQNVSSLEGLNNNILEALKSCIGFIAVMHPRGENSAPSGIAADTGIGVDRTRDSDCGVHRQRRKAPVAGHFVQAQIDRI